MIVLHVGACSCDYALDDDACACDDACARPYVAQCM